MSKVKIYSTPNCPWCQKAKQFFREKGISFEEFDVSSDQKARNEMLEKSGQLGVPVIDIMGKVVVGFDQSMISSVLALKA